MSANVDQRSKGQPNQVSNGSGKDVMKEDDPYLQQPVHSMRSWSEQTSDSAYGAPPMSSAGVTDSFYQNFYPSNMTYGFMNQGLSGSEGPWSNGADTMFGMGYDYSSMYGGFGFPPFNNWDYASEYWGNSQPQRKDQRGGYPPHQEEAYYPPEMIPADSYGMMTNGVAQVPPEPQEPIGSVEHGLRGMNLGGSGGAAPMQPSSSSATASVMVDSGRKKMGMDLSHHHHQAGGMQDTGFGGAPHPSEAPHMMMQHHPGPMGHAPQQPPPQSQPSPPSASSMMGSGSGVTASVSAGGNGAAAHIQQPKKTSWAAIASQPARSQQQLRPRTIPRAPVNPNKPHNMDIGTWDGRGGSNVAAGKLPVQPLQPPPTAPPPRAQSWATSSAPPPRAARQVGAPVAPPPSASASANSNNSSSGSSSAPGPSINSNSSNSGMGSNGPATSNAHSSSGYSNYSGPNSGQNSGSGSGSAAMNGGPISGGNARDGQQSTSSSSHSASLTPSVVLDPSKFSQYNPKDFNLNPKSARFFIIKSYSEDDIHRSIKYNIWCSTEHGNKRLDTAFREREGKGPVYLIYSVNGSGHFCGIAQMMSPVDYNKSAGVWEQDKWKGQFTVKWIYVKDVPNNQLRHIRLENNENKPVTNSRDTQEVPPEKGKQVLRILHAYKNTTSIFDDFVHYEKRQQEVAAQNAAAQHHRGDSHHHRGNEGRGDHFRGDRGDRGDGMGGRNNRDNRRGGYEMGGRGYDHHRGGGHDGGNRGGRHN